MGGSSSKCTETNSQNLKKLEEVSNELRECQKSLLLVKSKQPMEHITDDTLQVPETRKRSKVEQKYLKYKQKYLALKYSK